MKTSLIRWLLALSLLLPGVALAESPRPKVDPVRLAGLFHERSYGVPAEVLAEMKTLAYPWNLVFAVPPKGGADAPDGYVWETEGVIVDDPKFSWVAASLTSRERYEGEHVCALLQRGEDGRLRVADFLVRRLGGYNAFKASLIKPFARELPALLVDTYEGGRRNGTNLYEIFRMVPGEDGRLGWQQILQIPAQYDQNDISENCEFFADGEGNLQVKVTREWIREGRGPESATYGLSWDPRTGRFPLDPLRGQLVLLAPLAIRAAEVVGEPGRPDPGDEPSPELDIIEVGSIGGLKIGSTEKEVREAVAGKIFKGEDIVWEAIGEAVQEWIFPESGLSANMISEKIGGPKTVFDLTLNPPSKLLTDRGIGIESPKADVLRVYSDFKVEPESLDGFFEGEDIHLVGSIYGGMIFTFKDGKVVEIFLGAAAE